MSEQNRVLTFGEKAVGLSFNPAGNPKVNELKEMYAKIIDFCHENRADPNIGAEAKRYFSKAISYAEDSQMNGVKALTWQY